MSHLDDEELVDLALGDTGSLPPDAQAHVTECSECSATVASIRRTALLVATSDESVQWQSPPASVWESIEADVTGDDSTKDSGQASSQSSSQRAPAAMTAGDASTSGLPHPRSAPSVVGSTETTSLPARRARSRAATSGWMAGGVAAGLAIGLLAGRAVWSDETTPVPPSTTTIASTPLDTLDTRQQLGDASLLRAAEGVELVVDTEPLDARDGYLEVWLINSDLKRMVSVGVYRGSGPETFPVSQRLIDEGYVIVDVSQEGLDDRPEHSGDSLVRGVLET